MKNAKEFIVNGKRIKWQKPDALSSVVFYQASLPIILAAEAYKDSHSESVLSELKWLDEHSTIRLLHLALGQFSLFDEQRGKYVAFMEKDLFVLEGVCSECEMTYLLMYAVNNVAQAMSGSINISDV